MPAADPTLSGDFTLYPYTVGAGLTITVRISRRFRFRLWLGMVLIRIAARVLPFPVDVNEEVPDAR